MVCRSERGTEVQQLAAQLVSCDKESSSTGEDDDTPQVSFAKAIVNYTAAKAIVSNGSEGGMKLFSEATKLKDEGNTAWTAGSIPRAMSKWKQALAAFPIVHQVVFNVANTHIATQKVVAALLGFCAVIPMVPGMSHAFQAAALTSHMLEWCPQALAIANRALELSPNNGSMKGIARIQRKRMAKSSKGRGSKGSRGKGARATPESADSKNAFPIMRGAGIGHEVHHMDMATLEDNEKAGDQIHKMARRSPPIFKKVKVVTARLATY